jgi:DNA-directed RNA polymerase subunit RPC12/RpoP
MPSWMISCRNCSVDFEHTKIDDDTLVNYLDPAKPKLPSEGVELACPKCGHTTLYKRTDFFYRRDSKFRGASG